MAPSAKSLAMPPAPTHCACSNRRTPPQHGGGAGDAFLWKSVDEIGLFNFDPDIITDFNTAEDVLHFTNIDANETVAGNQDFTFIDQAAFTAPGQINWFTDGANTFIQLNTNADLTVDGIIQLNGVTNGDLVPIFL